MTNNNTWLIMMPASFILVSVLMTCLCWRKKRQKSDWVGLDGMVTQKNPDENVNHLPSVTVQCVPDILPTNNTDLRIAVPNTTRRSLPDIPLEGPLQPQNLVYDVNGDNSSEIYATVEPYSGKKMVNGIENRPSISQHSSISQADDPYARVNYDKMRKSEKTEHPYARVQSTTKEDENSTDEAATRTNIQPTNSQSNEPVPPPRSNRMSDQSISIDISAATAVAGAIPANQELPYMTPPVTQLNFSGDSQDSSKGYTSISVREPLANIRAQTKELKKPLRDLDPHYSTVSDDSDEVYTTIHDPNNQLYTSGSETYAQIQPLTVAAEVNPVPQEVDNNSKSAEEPDSAPQPPSVDSLKNVAHSRQASSSSSVANIGSPKPEKRQANSPLPPPPSNSPDIYLNSEKLTAKNLDDMYAKVQKNRKKNDEDVAGSTTMNKLNNEENASNIQVGCDSLKDHNYETLKKMSHRCSDPGYEKLKPKDDECNSEPGYASINGPDSLINSDPGYEVLKQRSLPPSESDPNYEELHLRSDSVGYSKIHESSSSTTSDGYSTINKQRKSDEKSRTSSSFDSELKDFSVDEPNYESMPSEISLTEHYSVLKSATTTTTTTTTGSESDPNYESVNHNDNNYESVKYSEEPPYERLNDNDSNRAGSDVGYETINKEPPYQKIKGDIDDDDDNDFPKKNVTRSSSRKSKRNVDDSDDDVVIQV